MIAYWQIVYRDGFACYYSKIGEVGVTTLICKTIIVIVLLLEVLIRAEFAEEREKHVE